MTTILFKDINSIFQNQQLEEKYDLLLISGGDSTVAFIINKYKYLNTPILIVPIGSGNDFAKNFNMTTKIKKIVEAVDKFETFTVNNIKANNKLKIINFASFGFDAKVTHMSSKFPRFTGKYKYPLAFLVCLFRENYESLKFESPSFNEIGQYSLAILVANSSNFSKRILNQFSDTSSSLFLVLIERTNTLKFLFLYFLFQTNRYSKRKEFKIIPIHRIKVDNTKYIFKPCADGFGIPEGPLDIEIETNLIHLLKI